MVFARWLDVEFAVFCDMVIDDILNKKAELVVTKPAESAVMKLPKNYTEALRLIAELEEQPRASKQLTVYASASNCARKGNSRQHRSSICWRTLSWVALSCVATVR